MMISQPCAECDNEVLLPIPGHTGLAECSQCGHPQDILDGNLPDVVYVDEATQLTADQYDHVKRTGRGIWIDGKDFVNHMKIKST